jgi:predicted RNA binding protein YcfA (HicA-like mRNA interferase family)
LIANYLIPVEAMQSRLKHAKRCMVSASLHSHGVYDESRMPMELAPISSLQCVHILWSLGFKIEESSATHVRLVRADRRRVVVARHKMLEPLELRVILITAGVTEEAFVEVLRQRAEPDELAQVASTGVRARLPGGMSGEGSEGATG